MYKETKIRILKYNQVCSETIFEIKPFILLIGIYTFELRTSLC